MPRAPNTMYSLQPAVSGGLTFQRNAPLRNKRVSEKIIARKPQPWVHLTPLEYFPRMETALGLGQEDTGWMPRPAHQGVPWKANPKGAAGLGGDQRDLGEPSKMFQFVERNFCANPLIKSTARNPPLPVGLGS